MSTQLNIFPNSLYNTRHPSPTLTHTCIILTAICGSSASWGTECESNRREGGRRDMWTLRESGRDSESGQGGRECALLFRMIIVIPCNFHHPMVEPHIFRTLYWMSPMQRNVQSKIILRKRWSTYTHTQAQTYAHTYVWQNVIMKR